MSSTFIPPHAGFCAVAWFWSRRCPLLLPKKHTDWKQSQPPGHAGHWNVCLFDYAGWTWLIHTSTRHQLCLRALLLLANTFSQDVMEGFHQSFFALDYKKTSQKKKKKKKTNSSLSHKFKKILHVSAQQPAIYNPHHSGLALKSDRNVGCRQIWQGCQFLKKDKSTEDCHNSPCPISKRLSCLGTPVLMMYNMEDD